MAWAADTQLGPYVLLSQIGTSEVWKARDTRLDRVVAIKRLANQLCDRFEQDARAIAALNHPNICQIHDVGPDYLVLEYIEGNPLHGPLGVAEAVRVAVQIAAALEKAHSRGVLHRDLKPANILVTEKGAAKLLYFGLDTLRRDTDAAGEPLDERSDVFGLGAVLYEILSGNSPFEGNDEPRPLQTSAEIARIVKRCLRKSPADRFQSMAEVKKALEQLTSKPADQQPSIAVLPFASMSGDKDNEYFCDGLAEEIINTLCRISGLKVIARTSAFAFKGKNEDIRQIADILGVTNVLEGSVRKSGNRVRITAQLIAAADGSHLWSERYDREISDVFAIQDEISQAIADALEGKLRPRERGARPPANSDAYQAYLEGRHCLFEMTPAGMARSLECYERSLRLDPNYAAARAALGLRAYLQAMFMGARPRDVIPSCLAAVSRALELDAESAEAYYVRGMVHAVHEWNWSAAGEDLSRAIELNPSFALAHLALSVILISQGSNDEALGELRRALELDPLNIQTRRDELWVLSVTGVVELAVERARALVDLFGSSWMSWYYAAFTLSHHGLHEEAAAALHKGLELNPGNVTLLGFLGLVRGRQGWPADAERIRAVREETAAREYVPFWLRAVASEGCGDMARCYQLLDQALDERELSAPIYLMHMRRAFQDDPRYQALLRRINVV